MTDIVLDDEQRYAVESDVSMIVDASPGSGKTRVLTQKASRLLTQGKNILCLCFTRAAAAEMSARVPDLPATTIHSFCNAAVGWKVPTGGTEDDGYQFLLHRYLTEPDFQFDWVLVDECQDLNPEQMDVVLSMVRDKIFAVGDVLQSIYGFQGAMGQNVLNIFRRAGCIDASLKNNYRSSPNVVERLNAWYPRNLIGKGPKDLGTTAILCRRNEDIFEASNFLKDAGIPHHVRLASSVSRDREWYVLSKSNRSLMTIHAAKGHEFDNVIIYNWYPDGKEEEDRVYYVAISRASKQIFEVPNLEELLTIIKQIS